MRFHKSSGRVFVRQSWLNDMVLCPERARLGITMPNMRSGSDATLMGTAVHYAIECAIDASGNMAADEMVKIGVDKFHALQLLEKWKETNIDPEKYEVYIDSMCNAWLEGIAPELEFGGRVEYQFAYPLGIEVGEWSVWCEGTIDYIDPNGVVYDWKTASRAYNAKEKQSTAVQPTVYAGAVNAMGWSDFPVDFRYGIMIRQEKPKSQIVRIERNESHMRWLRHAVRPAIGMALHVGVDKPWIMNDTSALCSERWCSYWSVCKGAFLTDADLAVRN